MVRTKRRRRTARAFDDSWPPREKLYLIGAYLIKAPAQARWAAGLRESDIRTVLECRDREECFELCDV